MQVLARPLLSLARAVSRGLVCFGSWGFAAKVVCRQKSAGSAHARSVKEKEALPGLISYEICKVLAESMLVVVLGSGMERQANGSTENEPRRKSACRPCRAAALLRKRGEGEWPTAGSPTLQREMRDPGTVGWAQGRPGAS